MGRYVLAVLVALLIAQPLPAREWVASELYINYPPIYFEAAGGPRGLYSDLQQAILTEADISHSTVYLSTKRAFREFWRARVQMVCCSNPGWWDDLESEDPRNHKLFSDPVILMRDIWVFRQGKGFDPETQLTGKRIGLIRGFGYRGLDQRQFTRIDRDSSDELIEELLKGELEAIILNEFVFGWWMERRGFPLEAGPTQDQVELSYMVHPSAQELMPRINQAIERLRQRDEITRQVRFYLPSYQPPEVGL